MIRALRWLLVAPMAALGWIIAFTAALVTHSLIDTYCPEQFKVFAAGTAPAYKARVATTAFLVGLSAATWAFLQTSALSAFVGACAGGLLALVITLRWHGRRKVSGYRQYQLFV